MDSSDGERLCEPCKNALSPLVEAILPGGVVEVLPSSELLGLHAVRRGSSVASCASGPRVE